jgi:3-hydroxymyristoyl/3-hydroxydecanoyl-(acyl carrier protein) dehydratase
LHYRPTHDVPGVRFYSCATQDCYAATPDAAADAMTAQALGTVDFAATVERAWADGVRVFIEHGPRGLCSGWIRRILGNREHLAVAMDGRGVHQLANTVAELLAAGVPMDTGPLFEHLVAAWPAGVDEPAHAPLTEPPAGTMRHAPRLPPVFAAAVPLVTEPDPLIPTAVPTAPTAPPQPALVVAGHRHLSAVHQDFLALQAEVHQQFLTSRRRAEILLSRMYDATRRGDSPIAVLDTPVPRLPARHRPSFSRAELERLASEPISAVFGPRFAAQDAYPLQTRVPRPPMLMVDRVTGIDAEPCALVPDPASTSPAVATGSIRTETDIRTGSWYLDAAGRMPVGLMVEAGQGDLLLMSWLGVDLLNRGERVYRLVSAELTFHGSPPAAGETLSYEINVDGHGEHDGARLSFFRGDCRVDGELRLTGRDCVAGFFTQEELARSGGVRWDPETERCDDDGPLDPPAVAGSARRFGPDALRAFADGRPADCFGPGWEKARSHVRSPRIPDGRMLGLHEVTEFDPAGGPWQRGYLRAETPVRPDEWFFEGHFKNDPCMPGSLMFEGCLQAMAFYLAATGFTIDRDGWRFEPVPDRPYRMRCRGQVTPENRRLTYEVFVTGLSVADGEPTLFADVLCSVDGVKAFHARRVGLRLVPDWPLSYWRRLGPAAVQTTGELVAPRELAGLQGYQEPGPVAVVDGFAFDYASLLAYAWGKPSEAFGPAYTAFDGPRRIARLPAPPYSFISRIASIDGPPGGMKIGSLAEFEYDIPEEVWYFQQNSYPAMPFGVLMEVVLQACGWLGFYVGSALNSDTDLLIRNLDGTGTLTGLVRPGTRTLRTRAELRQVSRSSDVIIESFAMECFADGQPVFNLSSVFGYFPQQAFENQLGLPPSEAELTRIAEPCEHTVDLTARPARYCDGELRLPGPMLLMIDRVTGHWPRAGRAGLGRLRAEKDIDPGEWFFKAHFFQDPVQPGSLGVEGMCQLLQFYLIERDAGAGMRRPRFEPVLPGEVTWRYRGQVVPTNRRVTIEMEITATGEDERGHYVVAEAWLWVDGKRIYHAENLGMRVVEGART